MNTKSDNSAAASEPGRGPKRVAICAAVIGVSILIVAVIGRWSYYRMNHVVLKEAVVRGTTAEIGARIDGKVESYLVEPGEQVAEGQIVAVLEHGHLSAALREAEAAVSAAEHSLAADELSLEQAKQRLSLNLAHAEGLCAGIAGEVEAARSVYDSTQKELNRIEALMKSNVSSHSELDRIQGERDEAFAKVKAKLGAQDAAKAACETARIELDTVQILEKQMASSRAKLNVLRERAALAAEDVSAATIRSPGDGWVIRRFVETGGSAKVGEPLVALWIGGLWVEAWSDEGDLKRFVPGCEVDLSVRAFPDLALTGTVESFGVITDPGMGEASAATGIQSLLPRKTRLPIRIALNESDPRLQPGLSVVAGIRDREDPGSPMRKVEALGRMFAQAVRRSSSQEQSE